MYCKCGFSLELDFNSNCLRCGQSYKVETKTTTLEIEAESESEALSKAWSEMDNAMDITSMRARKVTDG